MCGKAAVSHLSWKDIYAWSSSLTAAGPLPPDPQTRINISPSRLRRKSEPDSMIWETLPMLYHTDAGDVADEAVWPFLPTWSGGRLPYLKSGKLISTANARLRTSGDPFAPTFMPAWKKQNRALIFVSWFYEFDSRVHPQIPYAVFPLNQPFWAMAGLYTRTSNPKAPNPLSTTVITVEPNEVLKSVGHHRSPALLETPEQAITWLKGEGEAALGMLRPYPDESMGVDAVPMNIKIPGNQDVRLPGSLARGGDNKRASPAPGAIDF